MNLVSISAILFSTNRPITPNQEECPMTESPVSSKPINWIRPLVGGLLSAGVATFIWSGGSLFAYGFEEPLEWYASITGIFGGINGVFLSWFLIGGAIAFFFRSNLAALGIWFLFYVFCTFLGVF